MTEPIIEGAKVIEYSKGRYKVQLEIPECSTLNEHEIKRILAMSSWEVNPGFLADGFEGGRAVLMGRASPVQRGKVLLGGLQVSGIGYRKIIFDNRAIGTIPDEGVFYPPSNENFIDAAGTSMGTSHAEGTKAVYTRPKYRAMGTYTHPELSEKVRKTMEISGVKFERMAVPHVEAYGRYIDERLCDADGPFGFAVFTAPDRTMQRTGTWAVDEFNRHAQDGISMFDAVKIFYSLISPPICLLAGSLRELHDKGYAHLQPHLNNIYILGDTPLVMDWGTMRRLGEDREENIINRTIDLKRPADDFMRLFRGIFSQISAPFDMQATHMAMELVMESYSGHPEDEVKVIELVPEFSRKYGGDKTEFDLMAQWMKDEGIEGFPRVERKKATPKLDREMIRAVAGRIGRNDECPCGSGKKYKKCCGRA